MPKGRMYLREVGAYAAKRAGRSLSRAELAALVGSVPIRSDGSVTAVDVDAALERVAPARPLRPAQAPRSSALPERQMVALALALAGAGAAVAGSIPWALAVLIAACALALHRSATATPPVAQPPAVPAGEPLHELARTAAAPSRERKASSEVGTAWAREDASPATLPPLAALREAEAQLGARMRSHPPSAGLGAALAELSASALFRTRFWERAPLVVRGLPALREPAYALGEAELAAARLQPSARGAWFSVPPSPPAPPSPPSPPSPCAPRAPAGLSAPSAAGGADGARGAGREAERARLEALDFVRAAMQPLRVATSAPDIAAAEAAAADGAPPPARIDGDALARRLRADGATLSVTAAGCLFPAAARLCLDALAAFELPVNANLYASGARAPDGGRAAPAPAPGQPGAQQHACATPAHADTEDNLVFQLSGAKAWVLLHPACCAREGEAEAHVLPLADGAGWHALGKGGRALPRGCAGALLAAAQALARGAGDVEARGAPSAAAAPGDAPDGWLPAHAGRVRVVLLRAGDLLYVPRGWVHATSVGLGGARAAKAKPAARAQPPRAAAADEPAAELSVGLTLSVHTAAVHACVPAALAMAAAAATRRPDGWCPQLQLWSREGALARACAREPRLRRALRIGALAGAPCGVPRAEAGAGADDAGGAEAGELARLLEQLVWPHARAALGGAAPATMCAALGLPAGAFERALARHAACTRETVRQLRALYEGALSAAAQPSGGGSDGGRADAERAWARVSAVLDAHTVRQLGRGE